MNSLAQVGTSDMKKMNSLLKQYGGASSAPLEYDPSHGLVRQTVLGYSFNYTISNIERILVHKTEPGYTVELLCDSTSSCINSINPQFKSSYLAGISYFFSDEEAANSFAFYATDILKEDFKKKIFVSYTKPPTIKKEALKTAPEVTKQKLIKDEKTVSVEKKKEPKVKKKKSHLSVDAYSGDIGKDGDKYLTQFGKNLAKILQLAEKQELNKVAGVEIEGVRSARFKLPKATRNYINSYKGADCFIAEFGTKQYYEDLQELYDEVRDEIEAALPSEYEPVDMAYEPVYENSDDEVFHTEYYNSENPKKPSVVIRIAPDGKKNTLFLRIGKR